MSTSRHTASEQSGRPVRRAPGRAASEDYWGTLARTADLVSKLTSLADRYEAALQADDSPREDSRRRVALLRSTAESGRLLLRSWAPSALPLEPSGTSELERSDRARSRDVRASQRDAAAEARDERAVQRDVRVRAATGDEDLDWASRFLSACDRDEAAGDRAEALADRRAAQADREPPASWRGPDPDSQAATSALVTQLQKRAVVRQAQGVLMARAGLTAGEAFEALLLAATGPMTLDSVAEHVVRRGELPAGQRSA